MQVEFILASSGLPRGILDPKPAPHGLLDPTAAPSGPGSLGSLAPTKTIASQICFVGATFMVALASTSNGTDRKW
jgi:hypothetical protein